jgi:hypothetical protein
VAQRADTLCGLLLGVCLGAALSACGFAQDKAEAAAYAERYFATAAHDDISAVLPLYSPRFFAATPRETWLGTLTQVRDHCGKPSTHELQAWSVFNKVGKDAGISVKLVYDVKYERCRMTETLLVFKPAEGGFSVVGHHFQVNQAAPAGSGKTTTV